MSNNLYDIYRLLSSSIYDWRGRTTDQEFLLHENLLQENEYDYFCRLFMEQFCFDSQEVTIEAISEILFKIQRRSKVGPYKCFNICRRNGKKNRKIESPQGVLRFIQKEISCYLQDLYIPPKNVFGFVLFRSTYHNALFHVNHNPNVTACVDLKDFFGCTTQVHLYQPLSTLIDRNTSLPRNDLDVLTRGLIYLCSVGTKKHSLRYLPQGSPSSPILSNIALSSLDNEVSNWATKNNLKYSRYADDLVFSGASFEDSYFTQIGVITQRKGYLVNHKKTKKRTRKQQQMITGLVINDAHIRVSRNYYRNLRARVHNLEKRVSSASIDGISSMNAWKDQNFEALKFIFYEYCRFPWSNTTPKEYERYDIQHLKNIDIDFRRMYLHDSYRFINELVYTFQSPHALHNRSIKSFRSKHRKDVCASRKMDLHWLFHKILWEHYPNFCTIHVPSSIKQFIDKHFGDKYLVNAIEYYNTHPFVHKHKKTILEKEDDRIYLALFYLWHINTRYGYYKNSTFKSVYQTWSKSIFIEYEKIRGQLNYLLYVSPNRWEKFHRYDVLEPYFKNKAHQK